MTIRRLTSLGTTALILATLGCGSSGGGGTGGNGAGTGGSSATGGSKGTGGAGGAATGGTTGSGGSGGIKGTGGTGAGTGGSSATGGTTGTGGAGGSSGNAGSSGNGGAGGHAAATTALVDNDGSDNNTPGVAAPAASPSDTLFASLLAAEQIPYDLLVEPIDGSTEPVTASSLASYSTVIWYTGENFGVPPTISNTQQTTLQHWLDLGGKTLIVYSENVLQDFTVDWSTVHGNAFLTDYAGITGAEADVDEVNQGNLSGVNYTVTGGTVAAFTGLTFDIDSPSSFSTTADAFNPATGTDVLLTTPADPTDSGTDSATAVAVGHSKGTSKIVVVGIPIETVHGAPTGTQAQMFHAFLKYVGLKTN